VPLAGSLFPSTVYSRLLWPTQYLAVYFNGSYFALNPFLADWRLKGIVQRDLTGVKTRLKRSVMMNYIVANFAFKILKEHHHERSPKPVTASKQQLN
jgi:hypothetical protein